MKLRQQEKQPATKPKAANGSDVDQLGREHGSLG